MPRARRPRRGAGPRRRAPRDRRGGPSLAWRGSVCLILGWLPGRDAALLHDPRDLLSQRIDSAELDGLRVSGVLAVLPAGVSSPIPDVAALRQLDLVLADDDAAPPERLDALIETLPSFWLPRALRIQAALDDLTLGGGEAESLRARLGADLAALRRAPAARAAAELLCAQLHTRRSEPLHAAACLGRIPVSPEVDPQVLLAAADLERELGLLEIATQRLWLLLESYPDWEAVDAAMAGLQLEHEEVDSALARHFAGIAAEHDVGNAVLEGCLLERDGQWDAAGRAHQRALTAYPQMHDALHGLGRVLTALEQPEEALERLHAAYQTASQAGQERVLYSLAWLCQEHPDHAPDVCERLAGMLSEADTLALTGVAQCARDHPRRGARTLRRALALEPEHPLAREWLAWAREQYGLKAIAVRVVVVVLSIVWLTHAPRC